MHLHSLTLKNIRQFKQRTFVFRPGFNLLVGENGAGKTTILRSLLAALGSAQQMGRRPRLEDSDIRLRTRYAEIKAVIRHKNNRLEDFQFQKELWEPAKRSAPRAKLPLILLYSSNEAICSALKVKSSKHSRNFDRNPSRRNEEFLYASERYAFQEPVPENERRFGNSGWVRDFVGKMMSNFSADMSQFYWRFEPYDCSLVPEKDISENFPLDTELQNLARAFAMRWFEEESEHRKLPYVWPDQEKIVLAPDFYSKKRSSRDLPNLRDIWRGMKISAPERKFLESCSLEVKLTPRIMIQRKIGTLSLNQLSDGEQRLFSLFVDIARQLSINDPNSGFGEGEAIILIDEVDVHLHPKWQRRIVPALEDLFPNCQFIATTHSPFVIQATRRQQITPIDPNSTAHLSGGNSIEDIAEEIQGVPVPQRSVRAENLNTAANRYFMLLEKQSTGKQRVSRAALRTAEQSYREASEPFTSDPAIHAFLKLMTVKGRDQ
ncbi:AAA family ATPase [Massilia oculi]|uniref:AAA+ ATPase domain-containing protein n=1 Tax=Massilia oculi TaxID=945844 RepID=A0A2S2DLS1_9BURK|nr:AAA family ATPase [Massilia oculi]AWL06268.1 hypothetical protein DIR46_18745 [Massilia oculi]